MRLILIRHGETKLNKAMVFQGSTDVSLNEKGLNQAEAVKDKLKSFKITKVYSSPLNRAYETARIIFEDNIELIQDFSEVDFGLFEGLSHGEINEKYPSELNEFYKDYRGFTFPKGESYKEFYSRVKKSLELIIKNPNEDNVAIVAHGGTIKVIISALLGEEELFNKINVEQGCYSSVLVFNDNNIIEAINR